MNKILKNFWALTTCFLGDNTEEAFEKRLSENPIRELLVQEIRAVIIKHNSNYNETRAALEIVDLIERKWPLCNPQ